MGRGRAQAGSSRCENGSLWVWGEAWCPKPNRRPEAPREEEKKAEPADLEAGFFGAGAEPTEEAGFAGLVPGLRGGLPAASPGALLFWGRGVWDDWGPALGWDPGKRRPRECGLWRGS